MENDYHLETQEGKDRLKKIDLGKNSVKEKRWKSIVIQKSKKVRTDKNINSGRKNG